MILELKKDKNSTFTKTWWKNTIIYGQAKYTKIPLNIADQFPDFIMA
jgi:hypothetical protein